MKIKILFLAANPLGTDRLQLDEEIRSIREKIRAAEYRDEIELISAWAVRPDDLIQLLNEHQPQIVHFSGHGSPTGEILLVDSTGTAKPVSTGALKALFKTLKGNIRLVVLNACYSEAQAAAIIENIDCAVGMTTAIEDRTAAIFAASFYRALGFGRSVEEAFEQGKTALLLEGIPDDTVPDLRCRVGVQASQVTLVSPTVAPIMPPIVPEPAQPDKPSAPGVYEKAVYISYAPGPESESLVASLEQAMTARGLPSLRDRKDLNYKSSLESFTQLLAQGRCIILVISDAYLRSEDCMAELVLADQNRDLRQRIFPILLPDARIEKAINRLNYIQHWDAQIETLNQAMKQVTTMTNLSGIAADLDRYARIRANFDHIVELLNDMNALTPEAHAGDNFSTLIDAIQNALGSA
jgi:FMN phosphatase YigB (HAD superfamily)